MNRIFVTRWKSFIQFSSTAFFFMSRHAPFFGWASSDDPKELGLTQRIMIPVADLLHNEEKLEIWNYSLQLVCQGLERGYKEYDSLFVFF